jgi:glycosyltransferase involved in cell wall biosynthesis
MDMPRICLNMIVKNETHVVERALKSVSGIVSDYVILDTGSTDGTPAFIENVMHGLDIPGKVYHGDWVNFSQARNRALELAYEHSDSDFVLLIDADDEFACDEPSEYGDLDPGIDCYHIQKVHASIVYYVPFLLNIRRLKWRWHGAVHEYVSPQDTRVHSSANLTGSRILYLSGGGRSVGRTQKEKYLGDAKLLEDELARDPANARSRFYLAQSYRDAGEHELAIEHYRKRAQMAGWEEETFVAQLELARQMMSNGYPYDQFVGELLKAYEMRPTRVEPLYELTRYCREHKLHHQGYMFGKAALSIGLPPDALFVNKYMYEYGLLDELSICAYWAGRQLESFELCTRLLTGTHLPDSEWDRVVGNRDFSVEQVKAVTERYPQSVVSSIEERPKKPGTDVTLTMTACKRPELLAITINSFLNCCEDLHRISRWICIDDGSSEEDLAEFRQRYPFFELMVKDPAQKGHALSMNRLREEVETPYWLHLEDDWHFLARQPYIALAQEILEEDEQVAQVLFNRNYGETLACRHHVGGLVKRTTEGRRFRLHEYLPHGSDELRTFTSKLKPDSRHHAYWPHFSFRPSLMRTRDILGLGPFNPQAGHFEMEMAERYARGGFQSASLDVINALHTGKLTWESGDNAYSLNQQVQFG